MKIWDTLRAYWANDLTDHPATKRSAERAKAQPFVTPRTDAAPARPLDSGALLDEVRAARDPERNVMTPGQNALADAFAKLQLTVPANVTAVGLSATPDGPVDVVVPVKLGWHYFSTSAAQRREVSEHATYGEPSTTTLDRVTCPLCLDRLQSDPSLWPLEAQERLELALAGPPAADGDQWVRNGILYEMTDGQWVVKA